MTIERFTPTIDDATLRDLHTRLAAARLPTDDLHDVRDIDDIDDWSAGANPRYLRELVSYWRGGFDWRRQEARLRRFSHFTTTLDGTSIHFIHERGVGPRPLPLLLTHGFPDSFARFLDLIPLLVDPGAHGGDAADAFDVVVPSLPGFGFSGPPARHADLFHVGDRLHELMVDELDYRGYGAHGGDWGSTITEHLARDHGDAVVGIHLTDVPFWHAFRKPRDPSAAEAAYFAAIDSFQEREGAYAMIQGTRPQTLADGLADSPVGLAAWLVDLFQRWSDCGGHVESAFAKDDLLLNVMLYWATRSIGTSFLPYFDITHAGAPRWIAEAVKGWLGSTRVPAGFALFPADLSHPPREWAERFFHVARWTEMPIGGHFAALEQPELLADDLRAFFRPLREFA